MIQGSHRQTFLVSRAVLWLIAMVSPIHAGTDLSEDLNRLKELASKEQVDEAARLVRDLADQYESLAKSDRKKVQSALEKALKRPRKVSAPTLHVEILRTYGQIGDAGEKLAIKALRFGSVEKDPPILAATLRSIGSHRNPKNLKVLAAALRHEDIDVLKATAEALGLLDRAKESARKQAVEALIQRYSTIGRSNSIQGNVTVGNVDTKKFNAVAPSFESALRALTGRTDGVRNSADWHQWYQKHKKKKWPDVESPSLPSAMAASARSRGQ